MTYLNGFFNNISEVVSTSEIETISEIFTDRTFFNESYIWESLPEEWRDIILGRLNLPLDFPDYPWKVDKRTRILFSKAEEYHAPIIGAWYYLNLDYEELLSIIESEDSLWVESRKKWKFLQHFSKEYAVKILKGKIVSQKEFWDISQLYEENYVFFTGIDDIYSVHTLLLAEYEKEQLVQILTHLGFEQVDYFRFYIFRSEYVELWIEKNEVLLSVFNSFDELKNSKPVASLAQALKAWRKLIKSLPPGIELFCEPYQGDGLEDKRVSYFKRLGFRGTAERMYLNT